MKQRHKSLLFYTLILIFFIVSLQYVPALTTGLVSPINPGYNGSQIFIPVGNGNYINLQTAIDYGYLLKANSSSIPITLLPVKTPYEFASQIQITFSGQKMTLQEAINTGVFTNDVLQTGYLYTTTVPAGWDYGSVINVNTTSGSINLQNAININLLLLSSISFCYPAGVSTACTKGGVIVGGVCTGYSFLPLGSGCGSSAICDGKGYCTGWGGGNGCYGPNPPCPAGYTQSGSECIGPGTCPWGYTISGSDFYCNLHSGYDGRDSPGCLAGTTCTSWTGWSASSTAVDCAHQFTTCSCGGYGQPSCSSCTSISGSSWEIVPASSL